MTALRGGIMQDTSEGLGVKCTARHRRTRPSFAPKNGANDTFKYGDGTQVQLLVSIISDIVHY